jgi:hypothetical protein
MTGKDGVFSGDTAPGLCSNPLSSFFYRDFQEVTGINEMLDGKSGRIAV